MTSNTVSVDADLYVLVGSDDTLWPRLSSKWAEQKKPLTNRSEAIIRSAQSVPRAMSDWTFELIDVPAESFMALALPDFVPSADLSIIPDTCGWKPLRIVKSGLKDLLMKEDPEGGRFYPFTYIDANTGKEASSDFWYWLPKRLFLFRPKVKRERDRQKTPTAWGAIGGHVETWEIFHNRTFQEFISSFPYWTGSPEFQEIVFRPDLYRKIKAMGFTGLNEAPADNYLRHSQNQTVGYQFYGK